MKINEITKRVILYQNSQDKGMLMLELNETINNEATDNEEEQLVKRRIQRKLQNRLLR